jgi:hypothetical protein
MECFVYLLRQTNTFAQGLISYGIAGDTNGTSYISFELNPSGYPLVAYATGGAATLTSPTLVSLNQWTHLVVCRSGSTLSIFMNGTRVASASTSATVGSSGDALYVGSQWFANQATRQFQGYISNARILNGSSAYAAGSSTITVPTTPLTAITNTSLLLNFTNGGIIDNTAKNVLETVGNAQISTSVKKFGTGSLAFDGTGDYLTSYSSTNFEVGSGDFTLEAWLYPTSYNGFFGKNTTADHKYFKVDIQSDGTITFYVTNTGSSWQINSSSSAGVWELNTWWHFAIVRSGTSFKVYKNGTQIISATMSGSVYTTTNAPFILGATALPGFAYIQVYSGYIDDLRITKGVARYTANFTAPTAAFADQ